MVDYLTIVVTGNDENGENNKYFINNVILSFESGNNVSIKFLNYINKQVTVNYQDYTIVLNSMDKMTHNICYIDDDNYTSIKTLQQIMKNRSITNVIYKTGVIKETCHYSYIFILYSIIGFIIAYMLLKN